MADRQLREAPVERMAAVAAPALVLSAFACELYIKTLLVLQKKPYPRDGHNLRGLFKLLNGKTQNSVERLWNAYTETPSRQKMFAHFDATVGVIPRDLDWALREASNGFVTLRYAYEIDTSNFKYLIHEMPTFLRDVTLDLMPHWGEKEDLRDLTTSRDQ